MTRANVGWAMLVSKYVDSRGIKKKSPDIFVEAC